MWGPFSADPQLGLVYLPIEAPTNDVYGGHRPGDNLYGNTLVAVEAQDRQEGVAPAADSSRHLGLRHAGASDPDRHHRRRAADPGHRAADEAGVRVRVRSAQRPVRCGRWKSGRCRSRTLPGEKTATTQPIPAKPPAFDVQGISHDDLIDFTPELRAEAIKAIANYRIGPIYTPPTAGHADGNRGTIVVPGFGGGANWHSGAADPETGFVYVPSVTNPAVIGLNKNDPAPDEDRRRLHDGRRRAAARRLAADEAAIRPHHRVQHEQGRDRLA